jgi:hypothetical protein
MDAAAKVLEKWTAYFLAFAAGWVIGSMVVPAIRWGMQ